MRKLLACLVLTFFASAAAWSQAELKGKIIDTLEKKNLYQSTVTLLRKNDSVLVKFTRTNTSGEFLIKGIPAGDYILLVTYPKYADFADHFTLGAAELKDLGQLSLIQKSVLLEEVIVRQNRAVMIKGDTIEYKADSFKVHEGANVQDLLKRMPGLQVDRNGQISAHGEKVEKVLVDGEEFFSDDPAVVTKNLRADAIDKVQSFDKKSDQSEFTGVDDGVRSKTLNLVLKEDKKKGYFGKLVLGVGTRDRYSNEAMLNYFKGKKKFSAYGIMSNTGKIGLGWEDRDKFGGGSGFGDGDMEVGAGFIMITGGNTDEEFSDWEQDYSGEGVPRSIKAGAHFSDKWNSDKRHVNSNYSFNRQVNDAAGGSLSKFILPDSAYYSFEDHDVSSVKTRHLLTGFYDFKLDSFSSIRVRLNGNHSSAINEAFTVSGFDDINEDAVSRNTRRTSSETENRAVQASILWKQRMKKKGRTLSVSAAHKYSDKESTGFLFSVFEKFMDNPGTDSLDQFKTLFNRTLSTQSKLVYTEPVGSKSILEFNYAMSRNESTSDRKTFDKVNGKYEFLNLAFSNSYKLDYLSNSAGAKYQYNGKKLIANIGLNVGVSDYDQSDSLGVKVRDYSYTNLFPNARINYKLGPQKGFNFTYTGNNTPPSIDQIQPVRENSDPLNEIIGNPALDQSFRHQMSMFYHDYKVLTGRSVWVNGSFDFTDNAIVPSQVTTGGKRTTQYVNTDGNYNFWFSGSYGLELKKIETRIGFRLNGSGGRHVSFINSLKNTTNTKRGGLGLNISKYKQDKYSVELGSNFSYNNSTSTISSFGKTNYWSQDHHIGFNYHVDKIWVFSTDVQMNLREKLDVFDRNNNVVTWDARVTRKFFKKRNLEVELSVSDILDQNKGFSRNVSATNITERRYEVLKRYFLLSLNWNFSKSASTVN